MIFSSTNRRNYTASSILEASEYEELNSYNIYTTPLIESNGRFYINMDNLVKLCEEESTDVESVLYSLAEANRIDPNDIFISIDEESVFTDTELVQSLLPYNYAINPVSEDSIEYAIVEEFCDKTELYEDLDYLDILDDNFEDILSLDEETYIPSFGADPSQVQRKTETNLRDAAIRKDALERTKNKPSTPTPDNYPSLDQADPRTKELTLGGGKNNQQNTQQTNTNNPKSNTNQQQQTQPKPKKQAPKVDKKTQNQATTTDPKTGEQTTYQKNSDGSWTKTTKKYYQKGKNAILGNKKLAGGLGAAAGGALLAFANRKRIGRGLASLKNKLFKYERLAKLNPNKRGFFQRIIDKIKRMIARHS